MNDQKVSPVTIILVVVAAVAIFLPAVTFDFLFPNIRKQDLHYDDWQMWQFFFECVQNNHNGVVIFDAFAEIIDKVKLVLWMLLTVGLPMGGFAGAMFWKKKSDSKMTTGQTSAVFAKLSDLDEYQGKDQEGLILTKNVRMRLNTCFTHLLVVGPTGSGKTQSFFLPNIMKLNPEYSMVITDPKGELYQQTAAYQRSIGREPVMLKLDVKANSVCWNPLDIPDNPTTMSKLCRSIVENKGGSASGGGDPMWDNSAIDLLVALSYIVKSLPGSATSDDHPFGNLANVLEIVATRSFDAIIGLADYAVAELGVKEVRTRAQGFSSEMAPEDTRNSTRFVLKTALAPFSSSDVACITAQTDFDFCDLKRKPIALYVSVSEEKVAPLAAVLSTLYMQIFDALLGMGAGGKPVFFLMDEFANIGKVIGFPQYVATIRSRNLSVAVCLQSGEQLTRNYSEPEKQEIMNNLKVTVVLPGLKEEKTLQYLQTLGGKVAEMGKSSAKEDERAITKDRLPLNEIREMQDNYDTGIHEAIVIFPNKPAYKDRQRRSYSDPEVKSLLQKGGTSALPVRDPAMWVKIQNERFLGVSDLELLENIGTYIAFKGRVDKIPDAQKMLTLAKFNEVNKLCGLPMITEKGVAWAPKPALTARGALGRRMIEKAFGWAIAEGVLTIDPPKSKPKHLEDNPDTPD